MEKCLCETLHGLFHPAHHSPPQLFPPNPILQLYQYQYIKLSKQATLPPGTHWVLPPQSSKMLTHRLAECNRWCLIWALWQTQERAGGNKGERGSCISLIDIWEIVKFNENAPLGPEDRSPGPQAKIQREEKKKKRGKRKRKQKWKGKQCSIIKGRDVKGGSKE